MIAPRTHAPLGLRVEIAGPADGIGDSTWTAYFPAHPDSYDNIAFTHRCGMDGFTFRTFVVRDDDGPVLILPTFEGVFDASSMADGSVGGVVRALAGLAPGILRPRLLGIGLVECEWAGIGLRPGLSPPKIELAWRCALNSIEAAGRQVGASATVLLDLAPHDLARVPSAVLHAYAPVRTFPCARLPLTFESLDDYLAGLSRSTRQGLRRRFRAANSIHIERCRDVSPHLDRIMDLYRSTVERADVVLGVQRADYFRNVGVEVPGAHYVLYSLGEQLLGFNLLIEHGDTLIDKYFCMDSDLGRSHHLYFVSWLENIRYATSRGLVTYHAGAGSEETKRHLGCQFVRTRTFFRHSSRIAHRLLTFLAHAVSREPMVAAAPGGEA